MCALVLPIALFDGLVFAAKFVDILIDGSFTIGLIVVPKRELELSLVVVEAGRVVVLLDLFFTD